MSDLVRGASAIGGCGQVLQFSGGGWLHWSTGWAGCGGYDGACSPREETVRSPGVPVWHPPAPEERASAVRSVGLTAEQALARKRARDRRRQGLRP